MIISNLIHIEVTFNNLSHFNSELNFNSMIIGIATLLSCLTLNSYLLFDKNFSYLPGTLIHSSKDVFYGLVGIFPVIVGLAIYSSVVLNYHFRFKDP
jgi:hypothetical protein